MEKPEMTPELLAGILGGRPADFPLGEPIQLEGVQVESIRWTMPPRQIIEVDNGDGSVFMSSRNSLTPRKVSEVHEGDCTITVTCVDEDALPDGVRDFIREVRAVQAEDTARGNL